MSITSLLGFSSPADIDVSFTGEESRKLVEVKVGKNRREQFPLYLDGETVSGLVHIRLLGGKKLDHLGIKIELVGSIEMIYDRGRHSDFLSLSHELAAPGELHHNTKYDFTFKNVEKAYESYQGINIRLRYFVRVTISRRISDVVQERDLWVYSYKPLPEKNDASIKMEVGIENALHLEFEYNKSRYHLKDVIVGKIYFMLIRIRIKHMELSIIRQEMTGSGPNQYSESETIAKFEIMDGAPTRGETIPIRLFLGGYELTPTFIDVNKKFSTCYFLSLVLIDEENRRYFKQQEVTLYRRRVDDGFPPEGEGQNGP
ncbi:uncharacterized protein VTP21DRAFT_8917 [Calcarisporiella thermophila]|uniref:uncharacterized protein n=1 Tax=Calcarisporiella thermophila TaxID=911321 RepID=UPI003742DA26